MAPRRGATPMPTSKRGNFINCTYCGLPREPDACPIEVYQNDRWYRGLLCATCWNGGQGVSAEDVTGLFHRRDRLLWADDDVAVLRAKPMEHPSSMPGSMSSKSR